MAGNVAPIFENLPWVSGVQYVAADAANTKKTLVAAADIPAEGMRIDQISVVSTDTATKVFRVWQNIGGTDYLLLDYTIPIGAGTGTTPIVDLIQFIAPVLGYIMLQDADILKVENVAALTAAKTVDIVARGGKLTA